MLSNDSLQKYHVILDKYLNKEEQEEINQIIYPFLSHPEFQRRMTKEFLHHSDITLGEHIIEDAVVTYLLCQKTKNINQEIAVKIAMMHDLYVEPWQNNPLANVKYFSNKHGFRHPIEAVINAINWYPKVFEDNPEILIDGIIHHMYPLPVRRINSSFDNLELRNQELINNIDKEYLKMIINSSNRKRIGKFSITRSLFKEGRIMSKADKKVSFGQIKNISSAKALLTGKNKSLKK